MIVWRDQKAKEAVPVARAIWDYFRMADSEATDKVQARRSRSVYLEPVLSYFYSLPACQSFPSHEPRLTRQIIATTAISIISGSIAARATFHRLEGGCASAQRAYVGNATKLLRHGWG